MFGLFKRGSDSRGVNPSLDAVRFDATEYAYQGEPRPGQLRVWHTPQSDGLGAYFSPVPPDLPPNADTVDEIAAFYKRLVGDSGKLVEVKVMAAGGCAAVRTILSVPQQPTGRTYIGSLTIPFRDFSYVFKCQCEEGGPTGFKESILFDRSRAAGEPISIEGNKFKIPGFEPDAERYDAEFPDHPVARVRRVLAHVAGSLAIDEAVRKLPRFALPPVNAG